MMRKFDRYAILGNPAIHSLSPKIHTIFGEQTDEAIRYEIIEAPVDGFAKAVADFAQAGGCGANVTLPFKEQTLNLAEEATSRARIANAANTLVMNQGQVILADNTDGVGLIRDLQRLQLSPEGYRLLIIGAGGACRGILYDLLKTGLQSITIANRTLKRAEQIAAEFSSYGIVNAVSFATLGDQFFDCVINATSTSLTNVVPDVPTAITNRVQWGYDLAYKTVKQNETAFTRWLNQHGVSETHDGLGMLVHQAAESFTLWRNTRPETEPVIAELRK